MMPAWHQLVPMSGHVEESETARKLQLYATSIYQVHSFVCQLDYEAKKHNCSHRGTISFNPETRMKAVYICFIYAIHIFIVYWLVKRFLEKSRNFFVNIIMIMLIVFWLMYPACSMRAKRRVYSASCVRCTQTRHHRANHLRAWKDYRGFSRRVTHHVRAPSRAPCWIFLGQQNMF